MGHCVPAEALVVVLLAASIKMLAFAMLRGYTGISYGLLAAATLLAYLELLRSTAHGTRPEHVILALGCGSQSQQHGLVSHPPT